MTLPKITYIDKTNVGYPANRYFTHLDANEVKAVVNEIADAVDDMTAPVESDPVFTAWLDTNPLASFLTEETDPVFTAWLLATPPVMSETDPVFVAWLETNPLAGYLTEETDPVFALWLATNPLANFVETDDARLSDSRTPLSHGNEAHSATYITADDIPAIPADISELTDTTGLLFDGDYDSLDNKPVIPPDYGDHAGLYDPIGSATGAVGDHEIAYDHTLIASALQDISGQDLSTADNSTSQFITLGDIPAETDPVFSSSEAANFEAGDKNILDALRQLQVDQQDPSGFLDPANVGVSYSSSERKITLTHTSGYIDYYWKGEKKQLESPWTSTAHNEDSVAKYLMSTDGTNFTWSDNIWQFDYIQVAYVTGSRAFALREVHGIWSYSLHAAWHFLFGTYRKSGGGLVAGTFALNTDSDAANNPSFASAVITDEDLDSTIALWEEGTYTHLWFTGAGTANFNTTRSNVVYDEGGYAVERITYLTAAANNSAGKVQMVQQVILTGSKVSQAAVSGVSPTTAENVSFTPAGNIAAVNVQAALEELDTEKQAAGSYLTVESDPTAMAAIGDRTYTEQNYITDAESITASLDALDMALNDVADSIPAEYTLPLAASDTRGGIKAATKGEGDTVEVKIDTEGEKLYVPTYPSAGLSATVSATVILDKDDWVDESQTLTVTGVTATSINYFVFDSIVMMKRWGEAYVLATTQDTDSITFICETEPTEDIDFKVVIVK